MKNKSKTIDALRRVAERPGSPNEGEIAKRLLAQLGVKHWTPRQFIRSDWLKGKEVFYCYWCYRNDHGVIASDKTQVHRGETWLRIKFDRLKQPRWVPVTSPLGCHIGTEPFTGNESETLYRRDLDWEEHDREFLERMRSRIRELELDRGISVQLGDEMR